eukprot:TRINITY_DN36298_c0_g1_i2.p1 TRINITY_DN36298_c0_g1~~TRINITY_DN36298_c0_g1_i2.p1  ORF type:complete len:374 (-),score=77.70 TRINITY_DN36298_c0_g1_i2:62-1183(-)
MSRRPPRSTLSSSSAASDVYKRQVSTQSTGTGRSHKMEQQVFEMGYMKLKRWILQTDRVDKEALSRCSSKGALLRVLVDKQAVLLTPEQLTQLEQMEQDELEMSGPAPANDMNAVWNGIKNTQTFLPASSLPADAPRREGWVRFVCISDTHTHHADLGELPEGDVLLHCGDFSMGGKMEEVMNFNQWIGAQPHRTKIVIAGNHELSFDSRGREQAQSWLDGCQYICDQMVEVEGGIRIYGTPWTPYCGRWAFQCARGSEIRAKWEQIPQGVDIVMSHGPPLGRGDGSILGLRAGCSELLQEIQERVRPKVHVFGHIHEAAGSSSDGTTVFVNAASVGNHHRIVHEPYVFDLPTRESTTALAKMDPSPGEMGML